MHIRVTRGTERNQILLGIVSGLAAVLFMVDFKLQPRAASTGFVQPGRTIQVLAVLREDVISGLRQAPFAAGPETV
jgi:hypothetical protein